MQHLDEGTIHAWLDGALSAEEAERVERHAATCGECAAMVADARGFIAGASRIVSALDVVPGGVLPKQRTVAPNRSVWRALRLSPFRAALAATLMIAVASLLVVRAEGKKQTGIDVQRVAESSSASQPIVPMVSPAPAESTPVAPPVRSRPAAPPAQKRAEPAADVRTSASQAQVADVALADTNAAQRQGQGAARKIEGLTEVVVTSVPVIADSAAAKAAGASEIAARRAMVSNAARSAPQPGSGIAPDLARAFLARNVGPNGCYVVADTATWPRSLPTHFALAVDTSASPPRNVIRAVEPSGRESSTVLGEWRSNDAGVTLVFRVGDQRLVYSLHSGYLSQTVLGGAPIQARIERSSCRR